MPHPRARHPGPTTEPLSFMEHFAGFCCGRSIALARFPGALPDFPVISWIILLLSLGFAAWNINTVLVPAVGVMLLASLGAPRLHPFAGLRISLNFPLPPALHSSHFPQRIPTQAKGERRSRFVLGPSSASQTATLSLPPNRISREQLISSRGDNYPLLHPLHSSCPPLHCRALPALAGVDPPG